MGKQVVRKLGDREHVDQVKEQLDIDHPGSAARVADQIERCSVPRHADVGREARRGPDITPPADRNDITDPADAADSSDSTEKDDPTLNADAKEPIDPTERAEPTEPMDRTDPRDPMDRKESCDHRDHFDDGFMRAIFHAGGSSAHRALHPITPGRWVAAKAPATTARPVAAASPSAAASPMAVG